MRFKHQQKVKRNKGSILIGVILLFIMIVSISVAVVSRSFHGAILATDSRKGYSAYQASDTEVEKILNNIKNLDGKNDGAIPENTAFNTYCGDKCYKKDGITILSGTDKVSDIYFTEKKGASQSATRAVNVSMLDRVENPVSNLTVASDSRNKCDAKFSLTYASATTDTWKKISKLELRKSSSSGSSLENDSWVKLSSNSSDIDNEKLSATIKNSEFEYSKTYYFSLKAKNKNPLALDSLYYNKSVVRFESPAGESCNIDTGDSVALGCLSYGASSAHNPGSYACCEGTECYVCGIGWVADNDAGRNKCCTQSPCPPPPICSACACGGGGNIGACAVNECSSYTNTQSCAPCTPCPPPSP